MHRIAIAVALLMAGCVSGPAPAATDKAAMARQLAELHNTPEVWKAYAQAYVDQLMLATVDYHDFCETAVDIDGCEALSEQALAEVKTVMDDAIGHIDAIRPGLIDDYAAAAADIYTEEELRAALAFADTPIGRAMNAKAGAMLARTAPLEYERLTIWNSTLSSSLQIISDRYWPQYEPLFTPPSTDN